MPRMGPSPFGNARQQEFAMVLSDRRYNARLLASILLELGVPSLEQPACVEILPLVRDLRPDIVFLPVDASRPSSSLLVSELGKLLDAAMVAMVEAGDVDSDVAMLNAGADACIHDSDRVDAALAAVNTARRRRHPQGLDHSRPERAQVGDLAIDHARCAVTVAGEAVGLTATEFRVLDELIRHADVVLQAREIIERVTHRPYSDSEARDVLKVYIRRLRRKLAEAGIAASALINVRGFGYMLQSRDCWSSSQLDEWALPLPREPAGIATG